ncbi:MAG: SHOCT domain-containing protein [Paracoccaceae bacterium]
MRRFYTVTIAVLMFTGPVWAQENNFGYGHSHMSGWGYDGGWMLFGPLFMLMLLGLLIAAIVAVVRWSSNSSTGAAPSADPALATLNQRFAKGDIDAKEYAERKQLLQG